MMIRLTKAGDRPSVLTCLRDDGTSTWSSSNVGVPHDLLHYVVETRLGCHDAFFGLVAQGRDIDNFGTRNGVKDVYPAEAIWVEAIVGFLQAEMMSGGHFSLLDLEEMLGHQFPNLSPPKALTDAELDRLRSSAFDYLERWSAVPVGDVLELVFPV